MDVRTNGDLQRLNDHLRPAAGVEAVEYCHDFYPIKRPPEDDLKIGVECGCTLTGRIAIPRFISRSGYGAA